MADCTICSWEWSSVVNANAAPVTAPATALFFCSRIEEKPLLSWIEVMTRSKVIYHSQRYDIMLQKSAMKEIVWSKFPIYKILHNLPNHELHEFLLVHRLDQNTTLQPFLHHWNNNDQCPVFPLQLKKDLNLYSWILPHCMDSFPVRFTYAEKKYQKMVGREWSITYIITRISIASSDIP